MRILMATHHLYMGAGTETYVRTVALGLAARDHEVTVYCPLPGKVADELAAAGISVVDDIASLRHQFFAVAHVHHNVVATQVRATFPQLPVVWIRHGIAPELEQPPTFVPEVTLVVAPERARGLAAAGHDVHVVPNPIDTSFYAPRRPIRRKPKRAVAITNHLGAAAQTSIEHACNKLRIDVRHVGYPNNNVLDVRPAIDRADLVFAVGRTALEAGAMARAVLIHDHNGCDGWLDRSNYASAAEFAFSGQRSWRLPGGDELTELIAKEYSTDKGLEARELVEEHHALDVVLPRLEEHYRRAVELGRERLPDAAALAPTLTDQLAYYQREQQALRREQQALRAELARVYGSWSWRLLAPMRWLNRLGRRR